MSPHLVKHPVEAAIARLSASGDAESARILAALRDAISAQDDALRDLVADAPELREDVDDDGSSVEIRCAAGGFDRLLAAFGYEAVHATDRAALERAKARPGGPELGDGEVWLSPLALLEARIATDGGDPGGLAARGLLPVEVARPGGGREILYHDASPRIAASTPGP